jgi:hypothetical protein
MRRLQMSGLHRKNDLLGLAALGFIVEIEATVEARGPRLFSPRTRPSQTGAPASFFGEIVDIDLFDVVGGDRGYANTVLD